MIDTATEAQLDQWIADGRFASRDEAVAAAFELLRENEAKRDWLRAKIKASIDGGGAHSAEEVMDFVRARLDERRMSDAA